ncbi:MAG TPA: TetR/AcrR family transcriptional regulator [Peptococcaceae bacterium]|nr:TetR/AcrR family transcriptional regulator [Peptococcaceae bacterium]
MTKEERRTAILKAAGRVFYYKGYEGTKIEDIAKEAGIGKGTVYEYFESKQQLFEEMIAENRRSYIQSFLETVNTGRTFREKFIALAKYQANLIHEHIAFFENLAKSKIMAREMGALILEQNFKVAEILKTHVREAMENGELRSDLDLDIVSSLIFGTINQYCGVKVLYYHIHPEDLDYGKIADTVLQGIQRREIRGISSTSTRTEKRAEKFQKE